MKKALMILIPCVAVLLAVGITLLVLWNTQWKKDPEPPVEKTDTSAFTEDFFGTWETATGKKAHTLTILKSGYAVYKCESTVSTLRYSSKEANTITMWIEGYTYEFTLDGNTLVRARKGKTDGYTYKKTAE